MKPSDDIIARANKKASASNSMAERALAIAHSTLEYLDEQHTRPTEELEFGGFDVVPGKQGGKPCITGHRIPIDQVIAELIDCDRVREYAADLGIEVEKVNRALGAVSRYFGEPSNFALSGVGCSSELSAAGTKEAK